MSESAIAEADSRGRIGARHRTAGPPLGQAGGQFSVLAVRLTDVLIRVVQQIKIVLVFFQGQQDGERLPVRVHDVPRAALAQRVGGVVCRVLAHGSGLLCARILGRIVAGNHPGLILPYSWGRGKLDHFTAHRLRFVAQVQSTVELNEHQGSAIRGALFYALRNRFCGLSRGGTRDDQQVAVCAACPLVATCPVATLVSTLKPESGRGRDVPRPYTIQPPVENEGWRMENGRWRMEAGERMEFGLTL